MTPRGLLAMLLAGAAGVQAAEPPDSLALQAVYDAFRTCATLKLPPGLQRVGYPEDAATTAVSACRREQLALAGQYALDNPGTRGTAAYMEARRRRLIGEISALITDVRTSRPQELR